MKILFVSRGKLKSFKDSYESDGEDLILFGFNGMGVVSYEKELKGESGFFEDAAMLSKTAKTTVVCGCITDTRGQRRKSAVIADNGRLCGVSDMLHSVDGEVGAGAALRVYETKAGRMGVLVAEDIHFLDAVKSLALCGSDFIVCPFGRTMDSMQQVLVRAYAYAYGVPILFCGDGYSMIAAPDGSICFASPHSPASFELENVREYHLIETRRRGVFHLGE